MRKGLNSNRIWPNLNESITPVPPAKHDNNMIVGEYLIRQAKQRPDNIAVICNDTQLTFSVLDLQSNKMANWLLSRGLVKGDRAIILLPNCAEFAVAYFALMKIGVVAVILDFRFSPSEMAPLFDTTGAKALITHSRQKTFAARMFRDMKDLEHVIVVGDLEEENVLRPYVRVLTEGNSIKPDIFIGEEDEALYLYTSGTTGKPKGVILTYDHLTLFPETMKSFEPLSDKDVAGLVLPMSHISGPVYLNLMVNLGHTVVIIDEMRPKKILEAVQKHKITFFSAVPPSFR